MRIKIVLIIHVQGVAVLGFCFLMLSRFPAEGSERVSEHEVQDDED
jgi:hypothetical protein